ncbi:MAG: DNA repair protein RecO [Candidatus Scalindua sp.]
MDFCKTPAITLRRTDYKDSSQIITFYTRDFGKIQALAKGLKRSVKGISGGIDLLTYNHIVFIQRASSSLNILTEWALLDNFHLLRNNSRKYYSALYILELVREFTEENDKNEPLFDLFKNTLSEIANKGDPTVNTIAFEVQLLALLGYLPEMRCCASCKAKVDAKLLSSFSASEGGVLCTDCSRRIREKVKISGGSIATINYLAGKKVQDTGRLSIQSSLQVEIRKLLIYYLSFILDKKLKMWRYI